MVRHGNHFAFALIVSITSFTGSITAIARGAFSLDLHGCRIPATPSQWCCPAWSADAFAELTNRSRSVTTTTQTEMVGIRGSSQPSTCLSVTSGSTYAWTSRCIPDSGARTHTARVNRNRDVVQYPVVQTTVAWNSSVHRECVIPSRASLMQG